MSSNNVQFGATSWDSVELKSAHGGAKSNKEIWLRLDSGSNVVRCVTKPHQYLVHAFKDEGDSGFGAKIMCSSFHKSCPLCEEGNKPKRRWLVGVIDRKTQTYKILDMSVTVFKTIQELSRDDDYGNPEKYDIDIKVDKQGGATGYYNVIPKPAKPMSANDLEIKSSVNYDELLAKCTPPTPERVAEKMAFERAKKGGHSPVPTKTGSKPKPQMSAPVDMHGVSDDDFVFEAVQS